MQIRQIIGQGDGEIVGCDKCGVVEHLIENMTHVCDSSDTTPFATTIDMDRLPSRDFAPAI